MVCYEEHRIAAYVGVRVCWWGEWEGGDRVRHGIIRCSATSVRLEDFKRRIDHGGSVNHTPSSVETTFM